MTRRGRDTTDAMKAYILRCSKLVPKLTQLQIAQKVNDKFGRPVRQSTISRILHGDFSHLETQKRPSSIVKRNREPKWAGLESILRPGIQLMVGNGGTITDETLRGLARGVWDEIKMPGEKGPNFNSGWFRKLKRRLGIEPLRPGINGMSGSLDAKGWSEIPAVREICSHYAKGDIFSMDESLLCYKNVRNITLCVDASPEKNASSEHMVFLLCCNADGSERCNISFVINGKKGSIPPAIKRSDLVNNQVSSSTNPNVWITGDSTSEWITGDSISEWLSTFYEYIGPDRKVLLLMDDFSGHKRGQRLNPPPSNIQIKYLPSSTKSLFSPLDQGIIQTTKCHYRHQFVEFAIPKWKNGENPCNDIDDSHVLVWLSEAWFNRLQSSTISYCFRKTILDPPQASPGDVALEMEHETVEEE